MTLGPVTLGETLSCAQPPIAGPAPPPWFAARHKRGLRTSAIFCGRVLAVALTMAQASALDLKVVDDGDKNATLVALTGTVEPGDGLKVRGFIGALSASRPVVAQLGFAGGTRPEAMAIGRFFHQAGIRTVVAGKGTRCLSPCPLVFVGGRDPITGKPSYLKHSGAAVGFTGVVLNYQEKDYMVNDLNAAVANTQREILQIADYLHAVGANLEMLRYYQSVQQNETRFISNEEALDLGISVLVEETGQVVEPVSFRRN
jgi:hypothetical protein